MSVTEFAANTLTIEPLFSTSLPVSQEREAFSSKIQDINLRHAAATRLQISATKREALYSGGFEYVVVDRATYDQAQGEIDQLIAREARVRIGHWGYLLEKANEVDTKDGGHMLLEAYQGTLWHIQSLDKTETNIYPNSLDDVLQLHQRSVDQLTDYIDNNKETWNQILESVKLRGQVIFTPTSEVNEVSKAA